NAQASAESARPRVCQKEHLLRRGCRFPFECPSSFFPFVSRWVKGEFLIWTSDVRILTLLPVWTQPVGRQRRPQRDRGFRRLAFGFSAPLCGVWQTRLLDN